MPKWPTKIPQDLVEVTRNARPLREWARSSLFDPANAALSRTLKTFTKGEFERRRKQLQTLYEAMTIKHERLNTFFDSSHLSVPSDHPIVRDWERLLTRLRSAAKRERRKVVQRSRASADTANLQIPDCETRKN